MLAVGPGGQVALDGRVHEIVILLDDQHYARQAARTAYRDGGVYLLGRNYPTPGAAFQITPLWTANLSALVNLGDSSRYFTAALEYNFSENAYLSFGVSIPRGEKAEFEYGPAPDEAAIHAKSEFGLYPDLYYASISFYF